MSLESYMIRGAVTAFAGVGVYSAYTEGKARKDYRNSNLSMDGLFFYRFMGAACMLASPIIGAGTGACLYGIKRMPMLLINAEPKTQKIACLIVAIVASEAVAGWIGNR